MIPLRDDVVASRFPLVNWLVIGACTAVFLAQLGQPGMSAGEDLILRWGMIPARLLDPAAPIEVLVGYEPSRFGQLLPVYASAPPAAVPDWLTPLTCTFLHGGWAHFLGNMWFLVVFGDNVEDRLGRLGYLAFYLGCGVVASLTHLAANLDSTAPTVGASGAIAGVMGAYLLLYPRARVLTLVPLGFLLQMVVLPAIAFLGIWFGLQILLGAMSMGAMQGGGVAYGAHVGGFAAGLLAVLALRALGWLRPPPTVIVLQGRRMAPRRRRPPDPW